MNTQVFTQSAIKLTDDTIIYFDPYQIKEEYHDADYIFLTHDHYDHFDINSITKVLKDNTVLIGPEIMAENMQEITNNILIVKPENNYKLGSLEFRTYPAYNLDKPFHPKEKAYVGYNLKINDKWYYIMGDTDDTPEIQEVKTDICFIPIGGKFTMDVQEAAAYINKIKPKVAVPIHYGSIVGDITLKDNFINSVDKDIQVKIYIK